MTGDKGCVKPHLPLVVRHGELDPVHLEGMLTRSLMDLIEIVAELNDFGVGFKSCTELIDTTRPEGG